MKEIHVDRKQNARLTYVNAVMITDDAGYITASSKVTENELNMLNNARSNIQSQIDTLNNGVVKKADAPYIVEYSNEYLIGGYVLWSDGYCEQWGQRTGSITSIYAGGTITFTFPKALTMFDRAYVSAEANAGWGGVHIASSNSNSITVRATGASGNDHVEMIYWKVAGWIL